MSARLEICIDANDPEKLADFWCQALDYERGDFSDEVYVGLQPKPSKEGPIIFLQKVPEQKTTKDRIHLDIYSPEAESLIEKLKNIGATALGDRVRYNDSWWQIMQDPEGNEFCIEPEREKNLR